MNFFSRLSRFFSKRTNLILTASIILTIFGIFFFLRQVFFYQYEPEYYENYYYFSQWNIPNSTRGISDGELYKFVGYRLVEGENPFYLNFEIPPLGKYLYGLAEKTTGNPYLISVSLYLLSALLVYLLSRDLHKDKRLNLIVLLLFITTPFVATQIRETMLDLPLMFFYLLHVFFFLRYLKEKKIKPKTLNLILAGGCLGLATGVKPGIYTPLIGLIGALMIFFLEKKKKIAQVLLYAASVIAGYITAYFCYFIRHPNPIPWIRLHQKPLDFYLSSQNTIDHFNQWKSIFANTYQGWWQPGKLTSVGDWSLILPLGVIAAITTLIFSLKKKDRRWTYLSAVTLTFLLMNTFVPFWTRYLMPAIPLFILLISLLFKNKKHILFILILANLPFLYSSIAINKVDGHAQAITRFVSTRAYRELYRSLDFDQRKNIIEDDFIKLNEDFYEALGTRKIEVEIVDLETISPRQARATYDIKYTTNYGVATHQFTTDFYKKHNQWKMVWSWDMLWPGYGQNSQIIAEEGAPSLTKLLDQYGNNYITQGTGYMVYVIPRLMFNWNQSLNDFSRLIGKSTLYVDSKVKENIPDDLPRFIGMLDQSLGSDAVTQASAVKGVVLKEINYPIIIHGLPQSDQAVDHLFKLQETNPELFYLQADVFIEDNQGNKAEIPFPNFNSTSLTF